MPTRGRLCYSELDGRFWGTIPIEPTLLDKVLVSSPHPQTCVCVFMCSFSWRPKVNPLFCGLLLWFLRRTSHQFLSSPVQLLFSVPSQRRDNTWMLLYSTLYVGTRTRTFRSSHISSNKYWGISHVLPWNSSIWIYRMCTMMVKSLDTVVGCLSVNCTTPWKALSESCPGACPQIHIQ